MNAPARILKAGPRTRALIQKWEGIMDGDPSTVNLDPYICPAGYWTIGWGHVVLGPRGEMLKGGSARAAARAMYPRGITMAEAEALLAADLIKYENGVRPIARADCTAGQFGAMVALTLNIGIAAFRGSSVAAHHAAGRDAEAADAFRKWNKARVGGQLVALRGLTSRRAEERALYLGEAA